MQSRAFYFVNMSKSSPDFFDTVMSLEANSQPAMESLTQKGHSSMVGTYAQVERRRSGSNPWLFATSMDLAFSHHYVGKGKLVSCNNQSPRLPLLAMDSAAHSAVHLALQKEEYFSTVEFPLDWGAEGNQSRPERQEAAKKEGKKRMIESLPNCTKAFNKPASLPRSILSYKSTRSRSSSEPEEPGPALQALAARFLSATSSPIRVPSSPSHSTQCSSPLSVSVERVRLVEDHPCPLKSIKTQKLMINREKLIDFVKHNDPNKCFKIGPTKTKLPLGCRQNPRLGLSLHSSECRNDGALTLVMNVYFPGRCSAVVTKSTLQVNITLLNPQTNTTINSEIVSFALEERTVILNKFFPYIPLINSNCVAFELRMEVFLCNFFPDSLCESNTKIKESQDPAAGGYEVIDFITTH